MAYVASVGELEPSCPLSGMLPLCGTLTTLLTTGGMYPVPGESKGVLTSATGKNIDPDGAGSPRDPACWLAAGLGVAGDAGDGLCPFPLVRCGRACKPVADGSGRPDCKGARGPLAVGGGGLSKRGIASSTLTSTAVAKD